MNCSGQDSKRDGDDPRLGRIGERPRWIYHLTLPIRALHQVGAAVFLAAYLLDALPGPPRLYVLIAFVSGALLLACEGLRHRQLHRELSGVVTFVKLVLMGAAYHGFLPLKATMLLAFVIASLAAHAPGKLRHRLLF